MVTFIIEIYSSQTIAQVTNYIGHMCFKSLRPRWEKAMMLAQGCYDGNETFSRQFKILTEQETKKLGSFHW